VGDAEELSDGTAVGATVGDLERDSEGESVGNGNTLGTLLDTLEGTALGNLDGLVEGDELGISLGTSLGVPLGPELGFTDVLGGELGISLGCSLGGKITVASNPRSERLAAKSPDATESSLSAAATSVLTPEEGGAVIVIKTCKHCLPDTPIPLPSTILVQSSCITTASTITPPSSSIKARLLAIPASTVPLTTLTNCRPTSFFETPSSTAVSALIVVEGVLVGIFDGVVLGTSEGFTEGLVLGVKLGKRLGKSDGILL